MCSVASAGTATHLPRTSTSWNCAVRLTRRVMYVRVTPGASRALGVAGLLRCGTGLACTTGERGPAGMSSSLSTTVTGSATGGLLPFPFPFPLPVYEEGGASGAAARGEHCPASSWPPSVDAPSESSPSPAPEPAWAASSSRSPTSPSHSTSPTRSRTDSPGGTCQGVGGVGEQCAHIHAVTRHSARTTSVAGSGSFCAAPTVGARRSAAPTHVRRTGVDEVPMVVSTTTGQSMNRLAWRRDTWSDWHACGICLRPMTLLPETRAMGRTGTSTGKCAATRVACMVQHQHGAWVRA